MVESLEVEFESPKAGTDQEIHMGGACNQDVPHDPACD